MDGSMPNKTVLEVTEEIRAEEAAKGLEMKILLFLSFRCKSYSHLVPE
jgi:hypothetical protein